MEPITEKAKWRAVVINVIVWTSNSSTMEEVFCVLIHGWGAYVFKTGLTGLSHSSRLLFPARLEEHLEAAACDKKETGVEFQAPRSLGTPEPCWVLALWTMWGVPRRASWEAELWNGWEFREQGWWETEEHGRRSSCWGSVGNLGNPVTIILVGLN